MAHPRGTYGQLEDDLKEAKDDLPKKLRLMANYNGNINQLENALMRAAADKIEHLENQLESMSYDLRE